MEDNITHEGEWFKAQISKTGMDIRDFSIEIGYDSSTIYRWLSRKVIPIKKKKLLADAIGIDLRDYFEGMELLYSFTEKHNIKDKYSKLLNEYNNLKREFAAYKANNPGTEPGQ